MRANYLYGLALAFACAASIGIAENAMKQLESLAELRWKHRIILIQNENDCEVDISILREASTEVIDRDILWFAFCDDITASNFSGTLGDDFETEVQRKYFANNEASTVLIGKDGGVKNRSSSLDILALNQQIDTMPMRQREMMEVQVKAN